MTSSGARGDLVVDTTALDGCARALREVSGALSSTDAFLDVTALGLGHRDVVEAVRAFADGSRFRRTRLVQDLDALATSVASAASGLAGTDDDLARAAGRV